MFRSYWERAAKVTGERIADLSARPVAASPESHGPGHRADRWPPPPPGRRQRRSRRTTPVEPLSHLSGLISRVLESADQLADSTRRTRRTETEDELTAAEPGSTDHNRGMNPPAVVTGDRQGRLRLGLPVDRRPRRRGVAAGEPIGDVGGAVAALRDRGIRVVFATNNSAPTTAELLARLDGFGIESDRRRSGHVGRAPRPPCSSPASGHGPGRRRGAREPWPPGAWRRSADGRAGRRDAAVVGWSRSFDFDSLAATATAARRVGPADRHQRGPHPPHPGRSDARGGGAAGRGGHGLRRHPGDRRQAPPSRWPP